jgi:hypothetical protein
MARQNTSSNRSAFQHARATVVSASSPIEQPGSSLIDLDLPMSRSIKETGRRAFNLHLEQSSTIPSRQKSWLKLQPTAYKSSAAIRLFSGMPPRQLNTSSVVMRQQNCYKP